MAIKKEGPFKRFARVIREIRKRPLTLEGLLELNRALERKNEKPSIRFEDQSPQPKTAPDREIDFSDIPESTDDELKCARRVGRPAKGNPK